VRNFTINLLLSDGNKSNKYSFVLMIFNEAPFFSSGYKFKTQRI